MGIILWILIGIIGGWIANSVARRKNLPVNLLVGVIGAVAGGFSANLVTRHPVFALSWEAFFVGVLGTIVFLAFANMVQK